MSVCVTCQGTTRSVVFDTSTAALPPNESSVFLCGSFPNLLSYQRRNHLLHVTCWRKGMVVFVDYSPKCYPSRFHLLSRCRKIVAILADQQKESPKRYQRRFHLVPVTAFLVNHNLQNYHRQFHLLPVMAVLVHHSKTMSPSSITPINTAGYDASRGLSSQMLPTRKQPASGYRASRRSF